MRNNYYTTKVTCDICGFEKEYKTDFYLDEIADAEDFVRLTMPFRCVDENHAYLDLVTEKIEICNECFGELASDLREKYKFICVLNTGEKIIKKL